MISLPGRRVASYLAGIIAAAVSLTMSIFLLPASYRKGAKNGKNGAVSWQQGKGRLFFVPMWHRGLGG
jgi:hypothetical protein